MNEKKKELLDIREFAEDINKRLMTLSRKIDLYNSENIPIQDGYSHRIHLVDLTIENVVDHVNRLLKEYDKKEEVKNG